MRAPLFIGLFIAGLSLILPSVAESAPVATTIVSNALQTTVASVTAQLQTLAIRWLSIFMLAQFLITNLGLLKSGADIEAVWGKFAGSLLWFGFCFYLVDNGATFVQKVGGQMFAEAGNISGAPGIFTAGRMFDWGLKLSGALMSAVNEATGGGWFAVLDFLPSLLTFVSCLIILIVSAFIGFKIFLIKIELMITVMMTPLSFSFMALSALKDQGMAPFKQLISLIYRVMILAVIVSAMDKTGEAILAAFATVNSGSVTDVWNPVFAALMVFSLFGYLAYKSDSMAANLASGSTSLGTGDVAQAAAAGAAAGAALATGGASLAAGGSKATQAMSDFMKGIGGGGGGSVSNASSMGSGGSSAGTAPARPASLSAGSGFPTNSAGAPVRDSGGSPERGGGAVDASTSPNQPLDQGASKDTASAPQSSASLGDAAGAAGAASSGAALQDVAPAPSASSGSDGPAPSLQGSVPPASPSGAPGAGSGAPAAGSRRAPVRPTPSASAPSSAAPSSAGSAGKASSSAAPVSGQGHSASERVSSGGGQGGGKSGGGSAANAGIAGPASPLEQKVDKLLENASQAPRRPSLGERLGTLNEHVAREQASTHVSINVNAPD